MCLDSTLGENGGYLNQVSFECKHDIPYVPGEFNLPKNDDRWPVCQSKTTTVMPGKLLEGHGFISILEIKGTEIV